MDVVLKESPINDENNKKKAGYYIFDQLTLFYFKYIYRNLSRLAVMAPEVFYDRFIETDFEQHYVPQAFEQVCRQFLIRKNRSDELSDSFAYTSDGMNEYATNQSEKLLIIALNVVSTVTAPVLCSLIFIHIK